jgi:hypothetical protein
MQFIVFNVTIICNRVCIHVCNNDPPSQPKMAHLDVAAAELPLKAFLQGQKGCVHSILNADLKTCG